MSFYVSFMNILGKNHYQDEMYQLIENWEHKSNNKQIFGTFSTTKKW